MKNHIILINHALGQIETHEVDVEKFLEVYDLLHPDHKEVVEHLTFGAAARVPQIQQEISKSAPAPVARPMLAPVYEDDPIPSLSDRGRDAWANSEPAEVTELESETPQESAPPEQKPQSKEAADAEFLANLAALMAS